LLHKRSHHKSNRHTQRARAARRARLRARSARHHVALTRAEDEPRQRTVV
jgi:hypothetical protein